MMRRLTTSLVAGVLLAELAALATMVVQPPPFGGVRKADGWSLSGETVVIWGRTERAGLDIEEMTWVPVNVTVDDSGSRLVFSPLITVEYTGTLRQRRVQRLRALQRFVAIQNTVAGVISTTRAFAQLPTSIGTRESASSQIRVRYGWPLRSHQVSAERSEPFAQWDDADAVGLKVRLWEPRTPGGSGAQVYDGLIPLLPEWRGFALNVALWACVTWVTCSVWGRHAVPGVGASAAAARAATT